MRCQEKNMPLVMSYCDSMSSFQSSTLQGTILSHACVRKRLSCSNWVIEHHLTSFDEAKMRVL